MNSDLYFEGKKYISSTRAAKISGYVNDYIGQLCRDGKLDCRMIGRSWYVSFDSLLLHKNSKVGSPKNRSSKNHKELVIVNPPITSSSIPPKTFVSVDHEPVQSSEIALPILAEATVAIDPIFRAATPTDATGTIIPVTIVPTTEVKTVLHTTHHKIFAKKFPSMVGVMLAMIIAFIGFKTILSVNPDVAKVYSLAGQEISQIFLAEPAAVTLAMNNESFVSKTSSHINKFAISFYESVNLFFTETKSRIIVMISGPPKSDLAEMDHPLEIARSDPREGLVVVPIDERTDKEATIAKIKNTFSDDVRVEPGDDGVSGVITPVFRESNGNDYLYVLVPIKN